VQKSRQFDSGLSFFNAIENLKFTFFSKLLKYFRCVYFLETDMAKILISLMIILLFVVGSCGGDEKKDETLCPENDTFCHEAGDLLWSDRSANTMNWDDAVKYCTDLKGSLPTVDELRSLIENCSDTETGGECVVSSEGISIDSIDECNGCEWNDSGKYSSLKDVHVFWSSTQKEESDSIVFIVEFFNAAIKLTDKSALGAHVRCVK